MNKNLSHELNLIFQMIASDGTTASFMWELLKDPLVQVGPAKANFSVKYKTDTEEARSFICPFDIQDYTTLFVIRTKLEPSKGSDFCRANQVCCLHLSVQRVSVNMNIFKPSKLSNLRLN